MATRNAGAAAGDARDRVIEGGILDAARLDGFRKGLNENGYIDGQNVTVEPHWLEGNTIARRR